jgi:diguanylate cyclase (GGDEF)-like protein/PAS domain S-box-containing protein
VVDQEGRVLVVDDSAATRYLVGHTLREAGLTVIEAATGEAALQMVASAGPDLVLLDVNLPDVHGFEVRDRIKGNPLTRHLPVVHVSATAIGVANRVAGLEGGADAYLTHPVDSAELVATVRALLRLERSEEQVRIAAQHWALTFDDAVVGMVTHDLDGRILQANPAFCRMVGRDPDALHHLCILELTHPDDRDERAANLQRAVAGETWARQVDERYRHASGRHVWSQTSAVLVRDVAGRPLYFLSQVVDVTERRHATEFLKAVLHNISDGVVACDAEGRLAFSNPAAEGLPGLPVEWLAPAGWTEKAALLDPGGNRPIAARDLPLQRALDGEEVRDVEIVAVRPDGERRVLVNNGQAIVDAHGHRFGAVVVMRDATASKQAEAALTHQALHDPLTALPNRILLLDRMGQALSRIGRRPGSVATLFLDLDRFKVVNDSLGHDLGDELLVAIAGRLRSVVRPSDTVARLGGDEFVVLCEDVAGASGAIAVSDRIQEAVTTPCRLGSQDTEVVMSSSVGIVIANDDHIRPGDLLRDADTAMYAAKRRGRARHEVFDEAFRAQAVGRLEVENELRRAMDRDQLRVHYQPIVDLSSGRIAGVEALVRYEDPVRGLVGPDEFLDVAEESGLIVALGAWVLREACRQLRQWQDGAGDDRLQVSVNLSARQLTRASLVDVLEETLAQQDLPPGTLALELTESALMEAALSNPTILQRLKDAGARLGVDDFGTGYSSLTYLRRFPVDFIKIDRTFMRGLGSDPGDTAIVKAVIGLGKALGLLTIAEGVETSRHLELLRELGCDLAQGYYFSRPVPAEAVTEMLAARPRW